MEGDVLRTAWGPYLPAGTAFVALLTSPLLCFLNDNDLAEDKDASVHV